MNAEGAPAPRPQLQRPAGWSHSSVHELLRRPLYRGQVVWNQTKKRDRWGRKDATIRPDSDWITVEAPELRIVSDVVWNAARDRLTKIKAHLVVASDGRIGQRARDVDSVHLLAGFARCACCNASFYPLSRSHGRERAFFYGCSANHKRGQAVCANGFVMRKERIDDTVLQSLGGDVLRPAVVTAVLEGVFEARRPDVLGPALERQRGELVTVKREINRLIEAIAAGADMVAMVSALKAR